MIEKTLKIQKSNILLVLGGILAGLITLNLLFLVFIQNEAKTIKLLRNELQVLEQNQTIISSSKEITATYTKEIKQISEVFPNEETIPQFVSTLENVVRSYADEYTFKFNATAPVKEQERTFLPLTISLRTDFSRLLTFLEKIESLPYMTHITAIISKNPDGFIGKSEVIIGFKIYVQNPFNTK